MKSPTLLLAILFLFLASCSKDDNITDSPDVFFSFGEQIILDDINQEGVAINPKPLDNTNIELSILDPIGNARIVGLGEATHGTKEYFQMKHRIFKYLVEQHGFKAFVFEIDMAEARIFNDWVQWKRADDLTQLMADHMIFWEWHTTEVRDLLEYMRTYNQGKIEANMIGFYGVDTQFSDYDILQLVDILREANIPEADSVLIKNTRYQSTYQGYSDTFSNIIVEEIKTGIEYAKQIVIENEESIKISLGEHQWLWAKQLVRHIEQVHLVHLDFHQNDRFYLRDLYMAENTQWMFELLGADTKLTLWAHNGHLANDVTYRGTDGGSQGYYLKKEYGSDYQIIGFSFAKGSFTAEDADGPMIRARPLRVGALNTHTITEDPLKYSSNYFLYHSSLNNFILPLNNSNEGLLNWLDKSNPFLLLGSIFYGRVNIAEYYRDQNLKEFYDYLIHFDNTTNSVMLPR